MASQNSLELEQLNNKALGALLAFMCYDTSKQFNIEDLKNAAMVAAARLIGGISK